MTTELERPVMRDGDSYRARHYDKMNDAQKAYFDGLEKHFELEIVKIERRIADWIIAGNYDA